MRFVLIGPTHPFRGGIAHYTTSLSRTMAREHDVRLVSFSRQYPRFLFPGRTQQDRSERAFSVPSTPLIDSLNPRTWHRAVEEIVRFGPDAVVFQWWQPFFGLAYGSIMRHLSRRSSIPGFLLCHNIQGHETHFPGIAQLESWLVQRAFDQAAGFLGHSEEMARKIREMRPGVPVRKIYHPLYDFFLDFEQDEPLPVSDRAQILFFGKIREYKGLETLIDALGLIKGKLDFQAVIAGEFYLNPEPYYAQVKRLGLEEDVVWCDRYIPNEEVPRLFRSSDLVVLPYLRATQSGVVPVAYQFEVPVIASDVGGLSEVILEGETGYLVPPGNPAAIAERLLAYFRQGRQDEFRKKIRAFRKALTWESVVEAIVDMTQELLEKRPDAKSQ
ncbi:MAG: glycosyltransferase [Acidobacteriota bacterium]|nr:MAG: glycosyltransferase [Acidobacteriota bacterium]